jgi:hypothetical protein
VWIYDTEKKGQNMASAKRVLLLLFSGTPFAVLLISLAVTFIQIQLQISCFIANITAANKP